MDGTWVLILLCLAMLFGCYVSGLIPLIFNFSEDKLQLVSVFGAGLLVGTALTVIIPEGVHTLYSQQKIVEASRRGEETQVPGKTDKAAVVAIPASESRHDDHASDFHNYIGMALVLGFVFMLVVDQIGGSHVRAQDTEAGTSKDRSRITATLGLVVHAAADGVALGAAASTKHTDVEMIVFIAIMLHKAPAAFGLVTFLMHAGLDRSRIRRHLLIFALAAPLLAVITYFGISQKGKEALSTVNATGIAMLFSAGTFLYVATVHVLPEIVLRSHGGSVEINEVKGFRKKELVTLVLGTIMPLFLSLGHHH